MKFEIKEEVIKMPKYYKNSPDENRAESFAAKHFEDKLKGWNVIKKGKYDLLSDAKNRNSLITENNNKIIKFLESIGKQKELKILKRIAKIRGKNIVSGQPDIFAYKENTEEYFFAEVKTDRDKLSSEQKEVFALFNTILGSELEKNIKLIKVTMKENYGEPKTEKFIVTFNVTDIERQS